MQNGELFVLSEQDEFEAWARRQGMNMAQHPMFYIFLDEKTNEARYAWKAALGQCPPEPNAEGSPAWIAALKYLAAKIAEE